MLGQWVFLAWILFIGIRFGLFVQHFTSGGTAPFYSRPPGVEGFLPIGALVSLKYWLTSGTIHPVHPAALVLFLTFLAMGLLTRKIFLLLALPGRDPVRGDLEGRSTLVRPELPDLVTGSISCCAAVNICCCSFL